MSSHKGRYDKNAKESFRKKNTKICTSFNYKEGYG
jgi:hypothetical protein